MTRICISVHPVSHRLEWRGWGGKLVNALTAVSGGVYVFVEL